MVEYIWFVLTKTNLWKIWMLKKMYPGREHGGLFSVKEHRQVSKHLYKHLDDKYLKEFLKE